MFYLISTLLMVFLFGLRIFLAQKYFNQLPLGSDSAFKDSDYTVLQPILSGDKRLSDCLQANLDHTQDMQFIWLVDQNDSLAQDICQTIIDKQTNPSRIRLILCENVSDNLNPKVFKLQKGLKLVDTVYTVVLDDDSIIDKTVLPQIKLYAALPDEWLVTGIPYNDDKENFWSALLAAFVNSQSFFTYFSMAAVKDSRSLNGMFYFAKTATFKNHRLFEQIQDWLCDDLALATVCRTEHIRIIQSSLFCQVRTTVQSGWQYLLLLKRWLLFANVFIKQNFSFSFLLIAFLPAVLPLLLLSSSLLWGWHGLLWGLGLLTAKAFAQRLFRRHILKKEESLSALGFECLNDLLLPFIYLYTLITGPVIVWRQRKIRVADGKIRYVSFQSL
ncbi:ceramide glucosyltransferase [Streptococcus chenjunshii]|uniref:Ceramide glucosyltransferase n=1 Tax=Streptococcus chenjunshii TaxID=2173853 RepID=A0A372KKY6_9STRE|nr:glycosyltransferase [Streptococcus chenjunshii]AXQ79192.1 ceramide glucosyltransferase [Streptococcus chenjunshii]RFU50764.1 ceramide glucosyltransferase [Streptococcus chenjunshii]RFU52945.1 ceramide glucosyltransferase [Streptococcus chenjunshii]